MKTLTLDVKSLIASVALLALVGMAVGVMAVQGAEEATVASTVTAQLVSVSVSDGGVTYGTMDLSTTRSTAMADGDSVDDTQTATNDGNVNVDIAIRSSDAVSGGTDWNLAGSAGTDVFTHEWCTADCDGTPAWINFNDDNNTYSSIATGVGTSGTQAFDLRLGTPDVSTDSVEHTVTVTVQATASS